MTTCGYITNPSCEAIQQLDIHMCHRHTTGNQNSCQACQALVSYTEDTVYHIVMAGLSDRDLQHKCATHALLNNVKNINKLIEFCNAHKSSKLGLTSTLGVIKSTMRNPRMEPYPKTNHRPNPTMCGYCARPPHRNNNHDTRAAE